MLCNDEVLAILFLRKDFSDPSYLSVFQTNFDAT